MLVAVLQACAEPWHQGVIGPGPQSSIGLWRGANHLDVEVAGPKVEVLTPELALALLGDASWSVVEYHERAPVSAGALVAADLRRIDGTARFPDLPDAIRRMWAEQARFVASQRTADPQARTAIAVTAAEWLGDRVRISVRTIVGTFGLVNQCGGAEKPPVEAVFAGTAWSRTYDIARDGRIAVVRTATETLRYEPPDCNPAAP